MGVLIKGTDFTNGDQVTATSLDNLVDAATFDSTAVDNSTTQLSSGAIIVKDEGIVAAKLAGGASPANASRVKLNRGTFALSDAATIATDCSQSNVFTVILGGNRTLGAPTNGVAGGTYIWLIAQDGAGNRTLAFNSAFKFPGGVDPTLTTTANAVDIISAVTSDGSTFYCTPVLNLS
jgi:hypothetical protein